MQSDRRHTTYMFPFLPMRTESHLGILFGFSCPGLVRLSPAVAVACGLGLPGAGGWACPPGQGKDQDNRQGQT
eukprot:scaffold469426_cov46-Prasinocladus_malaysianus.AAC.1